MGLDLGGALEDREDARVAKHAADRIFEREAVAAVDLERVVGGGPGGAGGEQLGQNQGILFIRFAGTGTNEFDLMAVGDSILQRPECN